MKFSGAMMLGLNGVQRDNMEPKGKKKKDNVRYVDRNIRQQYL
jgi:hypothetical protein